MELHRRASERQKQSADWWRHACATARALRSGHRPPTLQVHGLVLRYDEEAYLQTTAGYSRFYGGDGQYVHTSAFAIGHPALVVGALVANGVANSSRRAAAQRDAMPQWREHHESQVLVTSQRVLCHSQSRGWLSFWYSGAQEFYPDLADWHVTLGFPETSPLRLSGPSAPIIALWVARGVLGDRWVSDPRLGALLA